MPIEDYPPDIQHADFHDPVQNYGGTTPTAWLSENVFARGRTDAVLNINPVVIPALANAAVWIHTPNADSTSRHAAHVGAIHDPFCIAPFHEPGMEIRWRFANPNNLRKVKLELFCRGETEPIWTLKWKRRDLLQGGHLQPSTLPNVFQNPQAGGGGWHGSMAWNGSIQVPINRQAEFPDGCVTVTHSPYKLKLSAGGGGGAQVAWTYFHVMVDSIELHWGTVAMLPAAPNVTPATRQAEIVNAEQVILNAMPMHGQRRVNSAAPHDIVLPSNAFCPTLNSLNTTHNAYRMYEGLWGQGPRLPLRAKVRVRDSGGNGLRAGRALGNAQMLWDWTSDPERGNGGRRGAMGHVGTVDAFLDDALDYKIGMNYDAPDESDNCHVDRGGKRGTGAPPVFLPHPGSPAFPFVTHATQDRPWAILTDIARQGASRGRTGVYFQPSRMAGDSYKIVAYLVYQKQPNGRPYLDQRISHTTFQQEIANNARPLPHRATQFFTIRRSIDVAHYLTKDGNVLNALNLAALPAFFAHGFVTLNVPGGATQIVQADYDADFANATGPMRNYFDGATNGLFSHALPAAQFAGNGTAIAPSLWAVTYNGWLPAMAGTTANLAGAQVNGANYDTYCTNTWTSEILKYLVYAHRVQRFGGVPGIVLFHFDGGDNHGRELGAAALPGNFPHSSTAEAAAHLSFPNGMMNAKPLLNLAVHELGHTLNLQHAPSHHAVPVPGPDAHSHHAAHCCVMNYDIPGLTFCAMCLLVLRGWDIRGMDTQGVNNHHP